MIGTAATVIGTEATVIGTEATVVASSEAGGFEGGAVGTGQRGERLLRDPRLLAGLFSGDIGNPFRESRMRVSRRLGACVVGALRTAAVGLPPVEPSCGHETTTV